MKIEAYIAVSLIMAASIFPGCSPVAPIAAPAATTENKTPVPATAPAAAAATITDLEPGAYHLSWRAGDRDANGYVTRGTELMRILPYKGKLYASNSMWMESEHMVPCELLVLDSPDAKWRLLHEFEINNLRLVCLQTVTFTTDGLGNKIQPVELLLAAPDEWGADVQVFSLEDNTGTLVPMSLGKVSKTATTRAIGLHRDAVTGIDTVFAGNDILGTVSGVYDPSVPGRIIWHKTAEMDMPAGERMMSFTNCNGQLYCASSRHIFKRIDGLSPSWQEVYFCPKETNPNGIRGLTAVPNPSGKGQVLLFAALSMVRHIDPSDNYKETVELDMKAYLSKLWETTVPFVLSAYNDFLPYTIPGTDETIWLFGFESSYLPFEVMKNPQWNVFKVDSLSNYFAGEARYFIRHADGDKISYGLGEVAAPSQPALVAVRTIATSPFLADQGRVLYFGGFDCNYQPSHNTAWIYKGVLKGK